MSELIFYEKPGCVGNARQRNLLRAHGVSFLRRDLLRELWTARTLRLFFGDAPVADWFNASAPAIKAGLIDPSACDEYVALSLMLEDPILIRRPLLQLGELRQSGFVAGPVLTALGVSLESEEDLQSCPREPKVVDYGDAA